MLEKDNKELLNPSSITLGHIERLVSAYEDAGALRGAFNVVSKFYQGWSPIVATYLSDNGGAGADLAVGEIKLRISDIETIISTLSDNQPVKTIYLDTPTQDKFAAGFDLAQLARTNIRGAGNLFFVNCAPRLEQAGKASNNQGEDIYIAMLPNGAIVSGVDSSSFMFFRDLVEDGNLEIHKVDIQTNGSQFRSRDIFPWLSGLLGNALIEPAKDGSWKKGMSIEERREFLGQFNFIDVKNNLGLEQIPHPDEAIIGRTDLHGNLKLSLSMDDVNPQWVSGEPIAVTIKGQTFETKFYESMFDAGSGNVGLAIGSSGDFADSSKHDPRYLQLAIINHSLKEELGITDADLKQGLKVRIEPVSDVSPMPTIYFENGKALPVFDDDVEADLSNSYEITYG